MSLELKRTVSHFFSDDSETVLRISTIKFDDGSSAITVSNDNESVMVHSKEQIETLVRHLKTIGDEIF